MESPYRSRRHSADRRVCANRWIVPLGVTVSLAMSATAVATRLTPAALEAFSRYVALTETRMTNEVSGGSAPLWIDRLPPDRREAAIRQLWRGEPVVDSLETRDGGKSIKVPSGLIQHWIGTVFIPGVSIEQTLRVIQDYARYPEIYPDVLRAKILRHEGNAFFYSMRVRKKKVVTVVLDLETDAQFFPLDATHLYSRGDTTRITEIAHHDTPDEQPVPAGSDRAFLWRLKTYGRYEERDGGTYLQSESISLSRDIPAAFRWIVAPLVRRFAKGTWAETLAATRSAVLRHAHSVGDQSKAR
jgi:hypothetical protein